mmetsp:Transcript_10508/g.32734  ORF Transcript_10508/g.32734 Transcript_10508/m.32734 type:complete len:306 (-) Transcript_10508:12-929(-)
MRSSSRRCARQRGRTSPRASPARGPRHPGRRWPPSPWRCLRWCARRRRACGRSCSALAPAAPSRRGWPRRPPLRSRHCSNACWWSRAPTHSSPSRCRSRRISCACSSRGPRLRRTRRRHRWATTRRRGRNLALQCWWVPRGGPRQPRPRCSRRKRRRHLRRIRLSTAERRWSSCATSGGARSSQPASTPCRAPWTTHFAASSRAWRHVRCLHSSAAAPRSTRCATSMASPMMSPTLLVLRCATCRRRRASRRRRTLACRRRRCWPTVAARSRQSVAGPFSERSRPPPLWYDGCRLLLSTRKKAKP